MKETMFIGLVIGSVMSSALFGFLIDNGSSWYSTDELVEEGVGEYYINDDNEKKFRFVIDD